MAKKSNYIAYELDWLNKRCKELMTYVEETLESGIEDRLDVRYSVNGNPIIKVIASKESQIKTLRDTLKELPTILESINRLRKAADTDEEEVSVQGGHDVPGFMDDDDDDDHQDPAGPKQLPMSTTSINFVDEDDDFEEL